ncbi:MAG: hypothetical protein ACXVCY_02050 [Pseudobdellovibrionaceae bacterium]
MKLNLSDAEKMFVKILEATLQDLFVVAEDSFETEAFRSYVAILIHYLSGNKSELRNFLDELKNRVQSVENHTSQDHFSKHYSSQNYSSEGKHSENQYSENQYSENEYLENCSEKRHENLGNNKHLLQRSLDLGELRYLILEKQILQTMSGEDLKKYYSELLIKHDKCDTAHLWMGEWYFIWARIYDMRNEHLTASQFYFKAKDAYTDIGAKKKAVKAHFNGIICLEREDSVSHLQYKYISLIKEARAVKEYSVVGMAFLALSQKLLDVGALRSSFDYVQRSLAYLSHEKGSSNYFKALLHRAHIYYLYGFMDKAKADFQEAKLSNHSEVLAALSVIEAKINIKTKDKTEDNARDKTRDKAKIKAGIDSSEYEVPNVSVSILPFGWVSRFQYENDNLQLLGSQEEQLILLLVKKPVSKEVIIEKIWGGQRDLDPEHIDLRFKKLIWRIKKKFPQMINYSNGMYSLRFNFKRLA